MHPQESASAAKKSKGGNPQVFMDIKFDGRDLGRIVIELRADVVPRTAGRFGII